MSLQEFWTSVRTGARLLLPATTADSSKRNASRIQALPQATQPWLTPRSVQGYEEDDFEFLAPAERARLSQCVSRFLAVAQKVPPDQPASDEQVQAALPAFRGVLEVMRPDKYSDMEALTIGKRVEQHLAGQVPEWVKDLRFETGEDANGDPALWIWVEVADAAAHADVFSQNTKRIRETLNSWLRRLGVQRWPYIRFRTASERAEEQQEGDGE